MPDAPAGGGTNATLSLYVNGTKTQTLDLSSRHAWVHGGYPYGDSPSTPSKPGEWDPGPHRFHDESRFLLPSIPAGATVKLQKDSGDTSAYVWIPSGVFRINGLVELDNIHLRGAGPWYTRLQATNIGDHFRGTGSNIKVFDLAYFGEIVQRQDGADRAAFEENFGTGSLIQNVWIEHALPPCTTIPSLP